ncbi:MAG: C2 family cysteine protease, partial [Gemmataceae bacterium]
MKRWFCLGAALLAMGLSSCAQQAPSDASAARPEAVNENDGAVTVQPALPPPEPPQPDPRPEKPREEKPREEKPRGEKPERPRTFAEVVRACFARWDTNRDGFVNAVEILQQVKNPHVLGEEAAAVAAIHQLQRFTKQPLAPTDAAGLIDYQPPPKVPTLPHEYEANLRLINEARRGVYENGAPSLDDFHQGHEGDCYFLATLGATVARDPLAVRRMLRPLQDGACELKFPVSAAVRVPRVTDAEIALGSRALNQGLWGAYFEKGYGLLAERKVAPTVGQDAVDAIGHGGHTTAAIHMFTGQRVEMIEFAKEKDKRGLAERVARALETAQKHRRLVCCSAGGTAPPGMGRHHAYAVLGYRPATR